MGFSSKLKIDSPLADSAKRRAAARRAVTKAAKNFQKNLQDAMENSPHTGRIVTKARGGNFRVRHQQSRRGQRPAPFTRFLKNSIRYRLISATESEVDVTADYAEHLVKMGRVIVSKGDLAAGQKDLNGTLKSELLGLI